MAKDEWWVCTFGSGQIHAGYYVKIKGTYIEARQKMFERYGNKWAFQYSWEEWERRKKDPYRMYPMEKELEVIE